MYPSTFREKEYVRLIALRRDLHGRVVSTKVEFVKTFEDYAAFIQKYRYTHDVYNQLATNRGKENGTKTTQRQRKVLYLDFDQLRLLPDFGSAEPIVKDHVSFRVTARAYAIVFTLLRVLYAFWREKVLDVFI